MMERATVRGVIHERIWNPPLRCAWGVSGGYRIRPYGVRGVFRTDIESALTVVRGVFRADKKIPRTMYGG